MKVFGCYLFVLLAVFAHGQDNYDTPLEELEWEEEMSGLMANEYEDNAQDYPKEDPGFRARITQKALDYVTDLALDLLMTQVQYIEVPAIQETIGTTDVTIQNVKIIRFDRPQSKIIPKAGIGLSWKIWDLNVRVTANYEAVMGFGFFGTVTKSGTVSVRTKDMSFTIEILIGRDRHTGRPTTISPNCFSGGDLIINFKGGWADMLNVGSTVFGNTIRGIIASQICSTAQAEIDKNLNSEMGTIPINETVAGLYDFNFGMTEYPTFNDKYLETSHKGAAYYHGNRIEPPFEPAFIPEFVNHTNKMVYLYVSDYVLNSGLYAAYLSGMLTYYVSNEMFPDDIKQVLSSACDFPTICLGTIFPGLPLKHPSGSVEIEVYASGCPHIRFYDGHAAVLSAGGNADFYVKENGTVSPIFQINFTVALDIAVKVNGSLVSFDVKSLCPKVDILSTSIGDIGTGFFYETIIRVASQSFILPKLAELGSKGFELPSSVDVKFNNPEIMKIDEPGVFVVATDIHVNIPTDLNLIELLKNTSSNTTSTPEDISTTTVTTPVTTTVTTTLTTPVTTPVTTQTTSKPQKRRRKNKRNRNQRRGRKNNENTDEALPSESPIIEEDSRMAVVGVTESTTVKVRRNGGRRSRNRKHRKQNRNDEDAAPVRSRVN